MILLLTLYALFATTFIIGREVVAVVPPLFFIGVRMILAGMLLLGFIKLFKKEHFRIERKDLFWFGGIILFHIYLSYALEFISLQYLTGAKVSLLYSLSPFLTALFAYLFFGDILSPRKWCGLIIGFLGFIPVLITQPAATESLSHNYYAEIVLLFSVICAVIGWIFMKRLISQHNHSYIFVNGIGMFFGGILSLIHSYLFELWPSVEFLSHNVPFLRSLLLLIFIGNVICYNLYGLLLHKYSTTTLSFFGVSTPLFAALFGWLWLQEQVSPWFYVTAALVALGLFIFYQQELKENLHLKEESYEKKQ